VVKLLLGMNIYKKAGPCPVCQRLGDLLGIGA
jgi:hypothetical protein